MELKPTSGYSFSGHIPIEICQDDWRSLLSNIEAETDTSKVYSLMLTDIKTSLEEAVSHTETQIKVLGLEAIKLSLKNLTITLIPEKKASSADPIYSHSQNMNEQKKSINYQQMNQEQLIQNHQNKPQTHMSTNLTTTVESEITTESALVSIDSNNMETHLPENNQNSSEELPLENNRRKRRKKLTKAEKAALLVEEKNTYLQQLGEKLQKARKMRCLSMKQIHKQTFVPLHYLEAIEKGQTD
ncbi:MAG: helix-turn-helix domain-containing protein, partial [Okeania sp. SIO4D6]|nr:helix-turn-helix domain-containing protein [Okeania sp. SIO4D6]